MIALSIRDTAHGQEKKLERVREETSATLKCGACSGKITDKSRVIRA